MNVSDSKGCAGRDGGLEDVSADGQAEMGAGFGGRVEVRNILNTVVDLNDQLDGACR